MAKATKKVVSRKPSRKGNATRTERDVLASEALMGILSSRAQHPLPKLSQEANLYAASAYIIADQMLEMKNRTSSELKSYLALQANNLSGRTAIAGNPRQAGV